MPGVLVLLSVLFQPGYAVQAKAAVMPDIDTCEQGAAMLREQVEFAFPGAKLQTFCVDVRPEDRPASLQRLDRAPT